MTFAEIRARARVGDSRERSGRRTLQGMVNYGVVIVTGSGGKGGPLLYSKLHSNVFARHSVSGELKAKYFAW